MKKPDLIKGTVVGIVYPAQPVFQKYQISFRISVELLHKGIEFPGNTPEISADDKKSHQEKHQVYGNKQPDQQIPLLEFESLVLRVSTALA